MQTNRAIAAHRGWSGKAPENTMAAFELAASDRRITWLELDVQLSKDQVPVVIHDFTLKRTTGNTGKVRDYTYRELAAMDNGSWFSKQFADQRIPSLEQVLVAMKGRLKLNIELKTAVGLYPGMERIVTGIIREHGMTDDVVLTSFDHYAVQRARSADPGIRAGLIFTGMPMLIREQLRFSGADFLSMDYRYLSQSFVKEMVEYGVDVMAWTVNEPDAIARLLAYHAELMICTNHPDRVFPYV